MQEAISKTCRKPGTVFHTYSGENSSKFLFGHPPLLRLTVLFSFVEVSFMYVTELKIYQKMHDYIFIDNVCIYIYICIYIYVEMGRTHGYIQQPKKSKIE